jgi:hypothetical protein
MSTAVFHGAAAPEIPDNSIFQPCGIKTPKIFL